MPGENPNYLNEHFQEHESGEYQMTNANKTETKTIRNGKTPGVLDPDDTRRGFYK